MTTPPLARKHTGMKISAKGLLSRLSKASKLDGPSRYSLQLLLGHLEDLGRRYYDGDPTVTDEFLQLYCLDANRPASEQAMTTIYVAPTCSCGKTMKLMNLTLHPRKFNQYTKRYECPDSVELPLAMKKDSGHQMHFEDITEAATQEVPTCS